MMTGAELKARRQALGLTQKELGEKLGLSKQTIHNLEVERYPSATPRLLHLALSYLEITHRHPALAKNYSSSRS